MKNIDQLKANIRQVRIEQRFMNYRNYPFPLNANDITNLISEFLCRLAEHEGQNWDDETEAWKDTAKSQMPP